MIELLNIEEFAETKAGGTPSTKVPEYWENGNIPWLNSGALNQGIVKSTSKFITKLGLEKSSAKLMPPDTVLIALTGATTGVAGYLTFEACANQSVVGILPSKRHFPKYLYYYLILIRQKVLKDASGAAQPGVNQKYVKNIQIPIPPLDEQKRIVAILDKCFEAIDKARANVEKNLQNAKELFQSRKNDLFKKLEEDLSKVPLPSVCDEIFAGGDAPKDNYSKEKTETFNIPIIANAVKDNGLYGYTNKIRVSKEKDLYLAVGIPFLSMKHFAKSLLPSSMAPALQGPITGMFLSSELHRKKS